MPFQPQKGCVWMRRSFCPPRWLWHLCLPDMLSALPQFTEKSSFAFYCQTAQLCIIFSVTYNRQTSISLFSLNRSVYGLFAPSEQQRSQTTEPALYLDLLKRPIPLLIQLYLSVGSLATLESSKNGVICRFQTSQTWQSCWQAPFELTGKQTLREGS